MKILKQLTLIALTTIMLFGCKPKDNDIKLAAEKSLAAASITGTTVDVKEGVLTVGGQLKDEALKVLAETTVKSVKGVKSVVNNITIPTSIVISTDNALITAVKDAVKDYPTVIANVKDGIVNLSGEIKKDGLPKLMMALSALKPKKIDNKLTVK